ncbi:MAG: ABC transporter permease [Candidatus Heimdallarchaeota archaeon]|nr:MAG: ABC transporter permease [Candidatus Heimdallarchaeota archaeon]
MVTKSLKKTEGQKEDIDILDRLKGIITHSYSRFVFKKAMFYLIVIFIALTFVFAIPRFMPGDPATRLLRPPPAGADPERMALYTEIKARMVAYFGLDKPLHEQFIEFWIHMLQFDLGSSYTYYPTPVVEIILPRLIYSMVLAIPVLFISFFLGNWIGGRAAFLKGRLNDLTYLFSVIAANAPFYWLGIMVFVYFVIGDNIFLSHPGGISPDMSRDLSLEFFIDTLRHYAPPFFTLIIVMTGGWATGMRAMTLYEKESEYLLYAKQMGFRTRTMRQYAQRNAFLPQFTGLNLRLNELIGMTIIVENIFLWPGIGALAGNAVNVQDYPLIVGTFLVTLVVVIVGNFLVDITYGFLDPRIKTGHGG